MAESWADTSARWRAVHWVTKTALRTVCLLDERKVFARAASKVVPSVHHWVVRRVVGTVEYLVAMKAAKMAERKDTRKGAWTAVCSVVSSAVKKVIVREVRLAEQMVG